MVPAESDPFEAAGKQVVCAHCGSAQFEHRRSMVQFERAGALGTDFPNRKTTVLKCLGCGLLLWFDDLKTP